MIFYKRPEYIKLYRICLLVQCLISIRISKTAFGCCTLSSLGYLSLSVFLKTPFRPVFKGLFLKWHPFFFLLSLLPLFFRSKRGMNLMHRVSHLSCRQLFVKILSRAKEYMGTRDAAEYEYIIRNKQIMRTKQIQKKKQLRT